MGDVYLAYERALDRKVAIKILPADLARSPEFVRRFQAEATAAAKLVHPNIIRIHRIGADAGRHYFVMDYIEGESLGGLLARRSKLSVIEALAIAEHVLAGLAAAHEQGLVHRDVKPGNILLDAANHRAALLADFGLAKSLESSSTRMTATGVVVGTLDYVSPEQGQGQPIDGRSDLYSVGVLLYQMLSGRLPFVADNPMALIFQHVHEPPPPLGKTAPGVPNAVVAVVDRLLAKSPADRPQSATHVLHDLRAARAESLPTATSVGDSPARRRRPTTDTGCSPLPVSLIDFRPAGWWRRARTQANAHPGRTVACVAAMVVLAVTCLGLTLFFKSRGSPPESYNGTALFVSETDPQPLREFSVGGSDLAAIRLGQEGRVLTVARTDGTVELIDAGSGQMLKSVATHADFSAGVAISPSGQVMAAVISKPQAGSSCELQVWDFREGDEPSTVASMTPRVSPVAVCDDRKMLVALVGEGASGQLVRWNVVEGREIDRQQLPLGETGAWTANSDGSWLAVANGPNEVTVGRPTKNGQELTFQKIPTSGQALTIHAGRRWLGVGRKNGTATLWDVEQNRPFAELNNQGVLIPRHDLRCFRTAPGDRDRPRCASLGSEPGLRSRRASRRRRHQRRIRTR